MTQLNTSKSIGRAAGKCTTADELLAMGDIGRCELLYGEVVMMSPAGAAHGVVATRFSTYLSDFVEFHDLGAIFAAETGFIIERDPDVVRAPDVSFVRKSRMPDPMPRGFFQGVPDLVVEVVSFDDTPREISDKVNMWLAHGAGAVWVADPVLMTVNICRVGHEPQRLTSTDEIRDEPLLPGFAVALSKIFKHP